MSLYTDVSGAKRYATVLCSKWFANAWSEELLGCQIAIQELFPIALSIEIWGHTLSNSKVLFLSDNLSVVHTIYKQTSKDEILMRLVRRRVLGALSFNIFLEKKQIPEKYNTMSEYLSHLKFQKALPVVPWLNHSAVDVDKQLLQI